MDIIQSLGLDQTLIFQFCLFIVTYLLLSKLVFEPYFKSFEMRKAKTVGNQQLAMKTLEEIKNLQLEYEQKTREINEQYRTIYEKVKKESTKEYEASIDQARQRVRDKLEKSRTKLQTEITKTQNELIKEVPEVGAQIATKLLGKEVRA